MLSFARWLWAVPAAVLLVALLPVTAEAHASLVSAEPMPGARLGSAPGVVVLDFSEPLDTSLSRVTVTAPGGRR